jgi:hypothetical protein
MFPGIISKINAKFPARNQFLNAILAPPLCLPALEDFFDLSSNFHGKNLENAFTFLKAIICSVAGPDSRNQSNSYKIKIGKKFFFTKFLTICR